MKRIYLCAQFKEQELMREWRRLLHNESHVVTSRWLDAKGESTDSHLDAMGACRIDLDDIDNADYVISKTLTRGELFTGGGRHVEFGYAIAKQKKLINVGGYENVFHHVAIVVPTIVKALEFLK